jgi:PAS domain S-box-containing protein
MTRLLSRSVRRLLGAVRSVDPETLRMGTAPSLPIRELDQIRDAFGSLVETLRRSQERLARTESLLSPVLQHAVDGIVTLDEEERILTWNRAAQEILGYGPEEIIGKGYGILVPEGDEEHEGFLRRVRREGSVRDFQAVRRDAGGREVVVSISRSLILGGDGGPTGMVEILRDISEHLRIQQELLTAEKMAAVGKMSSKAVHEIRNPLAAFHLNVDLLEDSLKGLPDDEAAEAAEIIRSLKRETRRLSQITEEYLQFSRLPRMQLGEEEINRVLLDLADFVTPDFRRKGVRIVMRLDERNPAARCDAGLLRQACLNLVRNAMEAAGPEGYIRLSTSDLGDRVEIRVADDGCGITQEDLPHIFEPFFTTKRDGTGLGLAVVRQIVEEHHGEIQVKSLPGRGSSFTIRIPKRTVG